MLDTRTLIEIIFIIGMLTMLSIFIFPNLLHAGTIDPNDPGPPGPATDYDTYISEAGAKYGVPICLIKAVIKQESNFDPKAVSSDECVGLMQLAPITIKDIDYGASSEHCGHMKVDPWDPQQNINGGTCYLSYLLYKYQYNKELALAAYNWGPTYMDNAIKAYGNDWNAIKPHTPLETQEYVPKVLGYYDRCVSGSWSFT